MQAVAESLLILILLASADDQALGERLAADLRERGGAQRVQVLVGEPARAALTETGLEMADLLASPAMGAALTRQRSELVLIRVEQRLVRGDADIQCQVWQQGRSERCGGIVGSTPPPPAVPGQEPVEPEAPDAYPLVRRQLLDLLGPRLASASNLAGAATTDLPRLVERQEWTQVLAVLAGKQDMTVKDHYFKVLAYSRLGQRDAATEAYAVMKEAHGQHFLVVAALEAIPSVPSSEMGADFGSRELRDPSPTEPTKEPGPAMDEEKRQKP